VKPRLTWLGRYFFLLNEFLLITKPTGNKFKPCWLIRMTGRKAVEEVNDSTYEVKGVEFRIYTVQKTFIFFAPSPAERRAWVDFLRQQQRYYDKKENPLIPYEQNQNHKGDHQHYAIKCCRHSLAS
jgi:hypothetical protein